MELILSAAFSGVRSILTPSSANTSALPHLLETDLFPCLATVTPAPAATSEATVEILNVPEPSPPVPHISIAVESSTEIRMDFERIVCANPTISSIVSPFALSATSNPAI